MALQSAMTELTFIKVDALRQRMETSKHESLVDVLANELIEGSVSKWIKRQEFHQLQQNPGQTARQFLVPLLS
jgi:hypothetical protein